MKPRLLRFAFTMCPVRPRVLTCWLGSNIPALPRITNVNIFWPSNLIGCKTSSPSAKDGNVNVSLGVSRALFCEGQCRKQPRPWSIGFAESRGWFSRMFSALKMVATAQQLQHYGRRHFGITLHEGGKGGGHKRPGCAWDQQVIVLAESGTDFVPQNHLKASYSPKKKCLREIRKRSFHLCLEHGKDVFFQRCDALEDKCLLDISDSVVWWAISSRVVL